MFLDVAVEAGVIYSNPAAVVKRAAVRGKEIALPSVEKFNALIRVSTISRHLAYLKKKLRLVRVRKNKPSGCITLRPGLVNLHRLPECVRNCSHEVDELEADFPPLAEAEKSGGCCPP